MKPRLRIKIFLVLIVSFIGIEICKEIFSRTKYESLFILISTVYFSILLLIAITIQVRMLIKLKTFYTYRTISLVLYLFILFCFISYTLTNNSIYSSILLILTVITIIYRPKNEFRLK